MAVKKTVVEKKASKPKTKRAASWSRQIGFGLSLVGIVVAVIAIFWPEVIGLTEDNAANCPLMNAGGVKPSSEEPQIYTREDLAWYDGTDESLPILIAVGGHVLNVSDARGMYSKTGPFHHLAGRPVTKQLVKQDYKVAIDFDENIETWSAEDKGNLKEVVSRYLKKYPRVGIYENWNAQMVFPSDPQVDDSKTPQNEENVLLKMTEDEIEIFDGTDPSRPIYVAVGGHVYDVINMRALYDTGGPYAVFAGRACTRGVVLPSLKDEDVSDDLSDFSDALKQKTRDWIDFFNTNHIKVAELIPDSIDQRAKRQKRHMMEKEAQNKALEKEKERLRQLQDGLPFFTSEELRRHDGSDPTLPIYMAISGRVLDVTSSKFYAKGAPRNMYAGRAVTRAVALQSIAESDLNDDVADFTEEQMATLEKRIAFFLGKYPTVGIYQVELYM